MKSTIAQRFQRLAAKKARRRSRVANGVRNCPSRHGWGQLRRGFSCGGRARQLLPAAQKEAERPVASVVPVAPKKRVSPFLRFIGFVNRKV